ncbi:MAG: hypothetical protein L3K07_03810 [Thermoplasmata archaeon]|nr:hypothetical protein [Thermoplasmata archaeon]
MSPKCDTCSVELPIVRYASLTHTLPVADTPAWGQLREILLGSDERKEKGGPLWSPAVYVGGVRLNSNVKELSAFVADVDDGTPAAVLEANLRKLGVEFVLHSTHSSTPEHPKHRIVVPLAAAVPVADWPSIWPALNDILVLGHSDPACKDPARAYYLPTHAPGATPFAVSAHGKRATVPARKPGPLPPVGAPARPDFQLVGGAAELLTRVEGGGADGPIFRRLLETTRGEPRAHSTNLALCGLLFKAGATVPQIAGFLDWPESNVSSTLKRFSTKGIYSIQLRKLAEQDPLVAAIVVESNRELPEPPRNPWEGRLGWDEEPLLPILFKDDSKNEDTAADDDDDAPTEGGQPVERGYVLYNQLVAELHFRPFRTIGLEPRVAIPTERGLEVLSPASDDFVDRMGYQLFSIRGRVIPFKSLKMAARTLTSRALARALPRARVVDLSLRVAPDGPLRSRIDMVDEARRCIVVSAEGWKLEEVGHPIFDARAHMLPLPVPTRADPADDKSWQRVNRLWKFVPLPDVQGGRNQRILALADLVQAILCPRTPKTVKVLAGDEGTGKSSMMARYQAVWDPSTVPHMKPPAPKDDDEAMNIAVNHAVVNFDNVSAISMELSDYICRISSGTGLVKRTAYTVQEETVVTVWRSVQINGITAIPRLADLLRRCLFLTPARIRSPLPKEFLDAEWEKDHPEVLGGLLDLCVATARVLRDTQLRPHSSAMADFVRVGRAMSIAMGVGEEAFLMAWESNVELQTDASAADRWVAALYDYFAPKQPGDHPVRAEDVAAWIMGTRPMSFPKGASAQTVGNAIGRSRAVLARLGVRLGRQKDHGQPVYYRLAADEVDPDAPDADSSVWGSPGSPGSPGVQLSLDRPQETRTPSGVSEPDRGNLADRQVPPGSPAGEPPLSGSPQVPPRFPRSRSGSGSSPGEPGQPLSLKSRIVRESAAEGVREESELGATRGDRARAAWAATHPEERVAAGDWANAACSSCPACQDNDHKAEECGCGRCSPWGHSSTTVATKHYCGIVKGGAP